MSSYDYDLIIIGSGPSGRSAAIQAGKLKRRVLVIDRKDRFGGVSVHTGTIPSKTLRETVLNLSGWRERSFYGRSYRVKDQIRAEDLKARLHMTLDHEVEPQILLAVTATESGGSESITGTVTISVKDKNFHVITVYCKLDTSSFLCLKATSINDVLYSWMLFTMFCMLLEKMQML